MSESLDGERLLLGEAKWTEKRPTKRDVERWAAELERRESPALPKKYAQMEQVRCLFVPELPSSEADVGVQLVTADALIAKRES